MESLKCILHELNVQAVTGPHTNVVEYLGAVAYNDPTRDDPTRGKLFGCVMELVSGTNLWHVVECAPRLFASQVPAAYQQRSVMYQCVARNAAILFMSLHRCLCMC